MNPLTESSKITLAIVDDEQLVLEGLACLFARNNEYDVVAVGQTWDNACRVARSVPQLALIDVGKLHPQKWNEVDSIPSPAVSSRFVALDDRVRDSSLRSVLRRGWHGYAAKTDSFDEIQAVVHGAAQAEQTFSVVARSRLQKTHLGWRIREDNVDPGLHLLSLRETEILARLAEGHSSASCATALQISPNTVDNHKARIMKKLGVRRLTDLVRFAISEGLVAAVGTFHRNASQADVSM